MSAAINFDLPKLAQYLCTNFETSFSRPWDTLPDDIKAHWTQVATEMALDLMNENIVEVIEK